MKTKLYLAYGSNLHRGQMAYRCPDARVVGKAKLSGYRLTFRGGEDRAVATIEPSEGHSVPVLLWEISARDEHALNVYEGYPRFYGKQEFPVRIAGEGASAMAYVMTPGFEIGTPAPEYLGTIMEGYREAGFDFDPLLDALEYSASHVANQDDAEQVELDY